MPEDVLGSYRFVDPIGVCSRPGCGLSLGEHRIRTSRGHHVLAERHCAGFMKSNGELLTTSVSTEE